MPFYSVVVHGHGIRMTFEDDSSPIVGFYAVRVVKAASVEDAEERAKSMVRKDWTVGSYSGLKQGPQLQLEIDKVAGATLAQWLMGRNRGHTFYGEERTLH